METVDVLGLCLFVYVCVHARGCVLERVCYVRVCRAVCVYLYVLTVCVVGRERREGERERGGGGREREKERKKGEGWSLKTNGPLGISYKIMRDRSHEISHPATGLWQAYIASIDF